MRKSREPESAMIIEMIGPKGIGKSTTAAEIAGRLGIRHYLGQGFHDLDAAELSRSEAWLDRVISVGRSPRLFVAALRARGGTPKESIRFALNACRRDRFAARAASEETGVLESGPLNSLFQASASYGHDVSEPLYSMTVPSDIYVRLRAPASVIAGRLESRGGVTSERVGQHVDWVARYDRSADAILAAVGAPVVEVDAVGPPGEVADEVIRRLAELGWPDNLGQH